jgi:ribosome maturation factor RimP
MLSKYIKTWQITQLEKFIPVDYAIEVLTQGLVDHLIPEREYLKAFGHKSKIHSRAVMYWLI